MSARAYILAALGLVVIVLTWAADHYHSKAEEWRDSAHQFQALSKQQEETITNMNQRQQQLAALDKTHTEALNAAETENYNLRRQLADGTRRMYVHAKCPATRTGGKTGSGGVGDGASVELATDSRQNVLDIRAGIISDRQKLTYLQQYIQTECLK
ncbi:lysis protein [Enterobacteriaceae bacterium ML5]|nr:lysis protein [Enterobacteriaceae bacterium ML5]